MNPRYQIFVSSTFRDLKDARERVIYELIRCGFIAVGMEQFHAADEEQMEFIRPLIDQTDYYVVILKGRYGSLASDGMGYTEKEYRYALEKGVPILAFLYEDLDSLTVQETDNDPVRLQKFRAFRNELSHNRLVSFWNNEQELVSKIKDAVFRMVFTKPGIGWIRGDHALDPKVYKELEEARLKISELNAKLAEAATDELQFPPYFSSGSDLFPVEVVVKGSAREKNNYIEKYSECYTWEISWDQIFILLVDYIYKEHHELGLAFVLRDFCYEKIISSKKEDIYGNITEYYSNKDFNEFIFSSEIDQKVICAIRNQFQGLGLIKTIIRERALCWTLTDKGRKYISHLTAIRRNTTPPAQPP